VIRSELPGALDNVFTFISGLDADIDFSLPGSMTVKFVIPANQQDAGFAILHWNGANGKNSAVKKTQMASSRSTQMLWVFLFWLANNLN